MVLYEVMFFQLIFFTTLSCVRLEVTTKCVNKNKGKLILAHLTLLLRWGETMSLWNWAANRTIEYGAVVE
jgi:hypothetical protein